MPSFSAVRHASEKTFSSCFCFGARTPMPSTGTPLLMPMSPVTRPAWVPALPVAGHAEFSGGSRGLPRMIGLGSALSHDGVGAFGQRFGHQKFKLARLVAAGRQAGAVIALDPDLRAVQFPGQVLEPFERRGQMAERNTRIAGEIHHRVLLHGKEPPHPPFRRRRPPYMGFAAGAARMPTAAVPYCSSPLTMALALAKSIWPAYFCLSAPIT